MSVLPLLLISTAIHIVTALSPVTRVLPARAVRLLFLLFLFFVFYSLLRTLFDPYRLMDDTFVVVRRQPVPVRLSQSRAVPC